MPKALAYALREGKLGIMDYYDMQNIKADTRMREEIAGDPQKSTGIGAGSDGE